MHPLTEQEAELKVDLKESDADTQMQTEEEKSDEAAQVSICSMSGFDLSLIGF